MTQPLTGSPSGSRNHRAALYCRQADSAAAGFGVPGKTVKLYPLHQLLQDFILPGQPRLQRLLQQDVRLDVVIFLILTLFPDDT